MDSVTFVHFFHTLEQQCHQSAPLWLMQGSTEAAESSPPPVFFKTKNAIQVLFFFFFKMSWSQGIGGDANARLG